MKMREIMRPGVMLSNIWPKSRETEGETLKGLEESVSLGFFEAIQVVDIPYPNERRQFAEVLKANILPGSMAMTRILNLNHLNLSSPERELRDRSVNVIVGELDSVREAGIARCTLISGPRPDSEEERKACLRHFRDSVDTICGAAKQTPALEIQIEPLDYFAHKRMVLGSAQEGIEISKDLSKRHANYSLCLDTAHMRLNEEDMVEAMRDGKDFLTDFHFCNPCVEKGHERYGDNHLLFGPPGALSGEDVADLMIEGNRVGLFTEERRPTVSFEILSSEEKKGSDLLRHCRTFFEECWEKAEARLAV
jgi:sugar phosphate isomerase/epimerase